MLPQRILQPCVAMRQCLASLGRYSVWEDEEALKKYFTSCAGKKFQEFLLSHDIVLTSTIL